MRLLIIGFLLTTTIGFSQKYSNGLKFDKKYYETVDNWVAFPKSEMDSTYIYGFVYIDEQAGFTYQLGNTFNIDKNNTYIPEQIDSTTSVKYRLEPNWKLVAIIPSEKLKELKLPETPDWLKYYKENKDSVSYLKNIGFHYNHVGACELALEHLEKAYKIEPHHEGLEFELAYAYNALEQFEKSIPILINAIENNKKNFYFYRELGFAYKNVGEIEQAEKIYKKGLRISKNKFEKSEMAVNMAQAYLEQKNRIKFDEWAKLTIKYAEKGSRYAQFIDLFEQKWNDK